MFSEGQAVPDSIADRYPEHIEGRGKTMLPAAHNPNLKARLTKKEAGKLDEDMLMQWLRQFHPAEVPAEKLSKDELLALVLSLNT